MVTTSFISRLCRAVDLIEQRSQQNRPLKVVKVRRGFREDPDAARARHFAAHPEDRDANIVIFKFFDEEEMADESQDCSAPAGPPREEVLKITGQDVSDAGRVGGGRTDLPEKRGHTLYNMCIS